MWPARRLGPELQAHARPSVPRSPCKQGEKRGGAQEPAFPLAASSENLRAGRLHPTCVCRMEGRRAPCTVFPALLALQPSRLGSFPASPQPFLLPTLFPSRQALILFLAPSQHLCSLVFGPPGISWGPRGYPLAPGCPCMFPSKQVSFSSPKRRGKEALSCAVRQPSIFSGEHTPCSLFKLNSWLTIFPTFHISLTGRTRSGAQLVANPRGVRLVECR